MSNENPLLAQAAQDVPPDSSTAPEGTNDGATSITDPGPDGGNQSGDSGDGGGKDSGRNLDNVTGEFNRKIADMRAEFSTGLAEIKGTLQGLQQSAPAAQGTPDINTMSSAQLEALLPNVPEAQKATLQNLVEQRRSAETTNKLVDERFAAHTFGEAKRVADTEAFRLYPELHDQFSRVRQETNKVLNEMGSSAGQNPYVMLHAAQAAGARLGIKVRTSQVVSGSQPGGNTAPAGDATGGEGSSISKEALAGISKTLGAAMPGGKFTEEQLKRIEENSKVYREHKNLFIRQ